MICITLDCNKFYSRRDLTSTLRLLWDDDVDEVFFFLGEEAVVRVGEESSAICT